MGQVSVIKTELLNITLHLNTNNYCSYCHRNSAWGYLNRIYRCQIQWNIYNTNIHVRYIGILTMHTCALRMSEQNRPHLLCTLQYSTRITDTDIVMIIMYGYVFLYTVVVPDTYWFMQEYTVWPYNALSRRDGADKLLSIWSPNVPRDPPLSATVSAWNKLFLIWTGIMYSPSSERPLAPHSRDKNKYGNQGRCDTWAVPGKWHQVSGGIAWTSQTGYLVWGTLGDSQDGTSEDFFFFSSIFPGEQRSQRRLPVIAET